MWWSGLILLFQVTLKFRRIWKELLFIERVYDLQVNRCLWPASTVMFLRVIELSMMNTEQGTELSLQSGPVLGTSLHRTPLDLQLNLQNALLCFLNSFLPSNMMGWEEMAQKKKLTRLPFTPGKRKDCVKAVVLIHNCVFLTDTFSETW